MRRALDKHEAGVGGGRMWLPLLYPGPVGAMATGVLR